VLLDRAPARIRVVRVRHTRNFVLFFFYGYGHHRALHSFPTRRSSDLVVVDPVALVKEIDGLRKLGVKIGRNLLLSDAAHLVLPRSEEHTSELQSPYDLVCRLLLEKKKQRRPIPLSLSDVTLHAQTAHM